MTIQDGTGKGLSSRFTKALIRPKSRGKSIEPCDANASSLKAGGRKAANVVEIHASRAQAGPAQAEPTSCGIAIERWPLPGLAPMTRVRTIFGDVHSIALRKGDEVLTKGGEFLPILWLNRIKLEAHILETKPDSNPIVIGPGTFGNAGELMVSPRQVICGDDMSGLSAPREASTLVSHAGVRRLRETGLTYTMFHVGREADVFCEGLYLSFPMEA